MDLTSKLSNIKNHLLDLAIRGKLVEQRPEDGTADELYAQIQEEKKKLIAEGKIKKEKSLPEITEDEIPFEIPESWKWVRLIDIVYNHGQKEPTSEFSYIEINSIDNVHQKLSDSESILSAKEAPSRARKIVKKGDILYSTVRPYLHNMCIIDKDFKKEPIASTGFAVMSCISGVNNKYLFSYLLSPEFDRYANDNENSKGTSYPAINDKRLYKALVPLPPLAEQKRIVAKLESYLAVIDKAEELIEKKANIDEEIRNKILDLAIRGKLVEQRPEDGTAEELYNQIQEEKKKLIADGKIKKEKSLPKITEEEIPFEIPASWKWVRITEIALNIFAGGDKPNNLTGNITETNKVPVVANGLVNEGIIGYTDSYSAEKGCITVSGRGTIGFPVIRTYNFFPIVRLIVINPSKLLFDKYLYYFLSSQKYDSTGTSIPQLTVPMIHPKIIPLPPLSEQKRIVAKIEELLPYCEKLK